MTLTNRIIDWHSALSTLLLNFDIFISSDHYSVGSCLVVFNIFGMFSRIFLVYKISHLFNPVTAPTFFDKFQRTAVLEYRNTRRHPSISKLEVLYLFNQFNLRLLYSQMSVFGFCMICYVLIFDVETYTWWSKIL